MSVFEVKFYFFLTKKVKSGWLISVPSITLPACLSEDPSILD